jgi:hypothetical protein
MTKDVAKFNSWIDPTTGERLYAQVTDDEKKSGYSEFSEGLLVAIAGHDESGDDGPIIREWYSRDHEHNIEAHSTAENARSEAEALLADAREASSSDGWPEQVEAISWGLLVPYGSVRETRTWEAEEGSDFDYMAEYALVPTGASEAQDAYASRLEDERVKLRSALCDVERLARERDKALSERDAERHALEATAAEAGKIASERDAALADAAKLRAEVGAAIELASVYRAERDAALAEVERLTRERDALIGAGCSPEQNALALIDHYHEQAMAAEREAARLRAALRGLLLSRDASWVGGHDWPEAIADALSALGIAPE